MTDTNALLAIGIALSLSTASPGPSFLMIARTAVSHGRRHAMQSAAGIAVAGLLFAVLAILGLTAIFRAAPAVYTVLKAVGGVYLIWTGIRIWRKARVPLDVRPGNGSGNPSGQKFWLNGFATQFTNPKAAVMFAGVFATFMPAHPSATFDLALIAMVLLIQCGWYSFVAVALSLEVPRNTYLRFKHVVDRAASTVLGAFGLRLLFSSSR